MGIEILQGIISLLVILGIAPLFAGLVNKQKAILTGRIGAPIMQPYYELQRLFKKETINAKGSSFISRITPDNKSCNNYNRRCNASNWILETTDKF